jgi:hypothetical protein
MIPCTICLAVVPFVSAAVALEKRLSRERRIIASKGAESPLSQAFLRLGSHLNYINVRSRRNYLIKGRRLAAHRATKIDRLNGAATD